MNHPSQNPFVDPNSNVYRNYQRKGERQNISPSDGAPVRPGLVLNPIVLAGIVGILAVVVLYFLLK